MNPQAAIPPPPSVGGLAPQVGDLAGKRIGRIANNKPGAELFLTKIEDLLKAKVPTATVVRLKMMKISAAPRSRKPGVSGGLGLRENTVTPSRGHDGQGGAIHSGCFAPAVK